MSLQYFISDFAEFKLDVESLGHSSFKVFAIEMKKWETNGFNNNLFIDGFCDMPAEFIIECLLPQDMAWGGLWDSLVDYMHYEFPSEKVASYLSKKK